MKTKEEREQQLRARLGVLTARLQRIETELVTPLDGGEPAEERDDEEVLEDLGTAGLLEIRMIEAALDRIANDSYGTCAVCGDPIGEKRLDVLPQTPTCRNCAT